MRRLFLSLALVATAAAAFSQTLNVNVGQVTYAYPAATTGDMSLTESSVTVCGKSFPISSIASINVDNSTVVDNTVSVAYNGTTAKVTVSGNIADLVTAKVSGAHVTLLQSEAVTDEITYTLSGSTTDGSLYMDGSLKATFVLNGVSIHNPDSAAINIQDGKRIDVVLPEGTASTLSDGINGSDDGSDAHNACFYVNGHTEFKDAGSLTITGNVKHAFTSDEYCIVKASAGTITVKSAVGDGFHIGQYYQQNGGVVSITATGDGLDVGAKKDTTKELNGQLLLNGGTFTATVSGETSDAMKCDADLTMAEGTVTLLSTGAGGRAVNCKGNVEISGGRLQGVCCGAVYDVGGDDERKSHGMKSDGNITISGGEVYIAASATKGTAFKTDYKLLFNGGKVMGIGAKECTAAAASTQGSKKYVGVSVKAGGTVSYNGVSFTVPSQYSNSSANVIVSCAGL